MIETKFFPKSISYMALPILKEKEFIFPHNERGKPDHIEKIVCDYYGISSKDVRHKSKYRTNCVPRQTIMFFMRCYTKLSLKEIGQRFGGRDHATTVHSVSKVRIRMREDPDYKQVVNYLDAMIQS